MDMPVNAPVDDPNADTEWNQILRDKGIIPQKPPSPTPMIEEALGEARRLAHENRLESKDLDELAELEDEEDEDFLKEYRNRRMAELSEISTASIYNQVYPLQKPDYSRDVTEASKKSFVLVLLTSSLGSNIESRLLTEIWRELATRFGDVKFCEIRADLCIEGYPERNTPTILVYKDGDIKKQIVTLKGFKGEETNIKDLEKLLIDIGAVKLNDSRLRRQAEEEVTRSTSSVRRGVPNNPDEDSDWE